MFKHVILGFLISGASVALALFAVARPSFAADLDMVEKATRAETAEQAVEMATKEILNLISEGQAYAKDNPERFYAEVESLLRPLVDFPRFARNVMGPYYKQANAEQRKRFSDSFKWSLVRTYALALTEFRDGEVNVLPPRKPPRDPDKVNVTQEIKYEGKPYIVVYRMTRDKSRLWRMQNLVVEGVNIGLNYKTQFAAAMKDPQYGGDLDAVIEAWSDFIEAGDDAAGEEDEGLEA